MSEKTDAKTVVVSGDFTLDWNLARDRGPEALNSVWEAAVCSRLRWQRGGAGLLADLINGVAKQIHGEVVYQVRQAKTPPRTRGPEDSKIGPEDRRFNHSHAVWEPLEFALKGSEAAKGREKEKAWRVVSFAGVNQRATKEPDGDWATVENDVADAQLVVLDDAHLGFRENRNLWPASLTVPDSAPWVLVKMSHPVAEGRLWEHLCANHIDKLVVVMTANDLRRTRAQISHSHSWERTAQDLVWEFTYNQSLIKLKECAHVAVSFDAAGAFVCSRGEKEPEYRLLFDPEVVEGMWEKTYPGRMVGYSSCLTAGIAKELMLAPAKPNIRRGIRAGLWALRSLHCEGYGHREKSAAKVEIEFPLDTVISALEAKEARCETEEALYKEASVPMRIGDNYWTILEAVCKDNLEMLATEVVKYGPKKKLAAVPLGRFKDLLTVDRQEIESLRSIGSLVNEYVAQHRPKNPLSIAVFGPPGSGKSFGIKQLALSLQPGEIEIREFNLSQFRSFNDLLSAFHQVRDIGLGGKIPLIFWDEFDSAFEVNYGWLRHFLAPMQDGAFQQGDLLHPIGKAIFVFAGGTSSAFEGFGKNGEENLLRAAKVPDFISRLKGYLNVLGPNQTGANDTYYVLRRAILLRSMFERNTKHLLHNDVLEIDEGVLRAFLLTTTYNHGARSMESIIAMSQLDGKARFERSSLPTKAQLDLHVDGQNFLARVHQLEIDKLPADVLERMAKMAHQVYRNQQEGEGWKLGPLTNEKTQEQPSDETRARMAKIGHTVNGEKQEADGWRLGTVKSETTKENPSLVDYELLPDGEKHQNRQQVLDIPAKLASAGCTIVRTREREPPFVFPPDVLERLASLEHTRWMRLKASNGWRYGDKKDDDKKEHPSMLPWKKGELDAYAGFVECLGQMELSEQEKEKDRAAIRGVARILNVAGYTIVGARGRVEL